MDRREQRCLLVDLDVARRNSLRTVRRLNCVDELLAVERGWAHPEERLRPDRLEIRDANRRPEEMNRLASHLLDRRLGRFNLVNAPVPFDSDDAPARSLAAHAARRLDRHQRTGGGCLDQGTAGREHGHHKQAKDLRHFPR